MIKLQDFATQQGVTDRQVQRLLNKYEDELAGLYQRKGPNGTWLTEEACDILRSKMRQAPAAVIEKDARVTELEARVRELEKMLAMAQAATLEAQAATQKAQDKAQALLDDAADNKRAIEDAKAAQDRREKELQTREEGFAQELEAARQEASKAAQGAAEEKAAKDLDQVKRAHQAELDALDKKIQELENRKLGDYLKGLFRKKGKKQDGTENQGTDSGTEGGE